MTAKNQKTNAAFEKKVRAAVTKLENDGVRITNASVREEMGGGSFRDIGPIVKAVVAEKEARAKAESQVPDMPEDVVELATAIWEAAYRRADEVAAADRRSHAEEVKALREELTDREGDVGVVEDERDEVLARAEAAEKELGQLQGQIDDLRVEIARLEGRLLGREEAKAIEVAKEKVKPDPEDDRQIPLFPHKDAGPNYVTVDVNTLSDDEHDGGSQDEAA